MAVCRRQHCITMSTKKERIISSTPRIQRAIWVGGTHDMGSGTRASQGWGWAPQGWGGLVGRRRGYSPKSGASQGSGTKKGLSGWEGAVRVATTTKGAPGFASRAARPSDPAGRLQSESIAVKGHASLGVSLECETPSPRPPRCARLGSSSCGRRRQACELLARTVGAVLCVLQRGSARVARGSKMLC